jgi:hypothetical protein
VPGLTVPGGQSTPSRLVRRGRKEEEAEDDDDDDDEEDEMLRLLNHAPVTGLPLWLRLPIPSPTAVAGFRDGILARQLVLIDCALGEDNGMPMRLSVQADSWDFGKASGVECRQR